MNRLRYHPTYLKVRAGIQQLTLPLGIFQLIRTLLLPTSFDVILLILIALLYAGIEFDWF
ncbi:hypothetical protein [Ammoniphilus sp. YIM 78166]|uniref:hypothetical protein n=1 Tax=Ammoniphilus sp. YIM 78166 TaxID=1644106 RepID=UPI00106F2521|nr:hypothetical protein [Ammoniphilus sp. YIM 78166]